MHEIRILSLCWPTLLPAGNQHDATINETKKKQQKMEDVQNTKAVT